MALLALAGCREDEQNRALIYDKGTYAGAPMPELDAEGRAALEARADQQNF